MSRIGSAGRAALLASIGPMVLATSSPGEWSLTDLIVLLSLAALLGAAVTMLRAAAFPRLEESSGTAVDLIVVAALTLPFLFARDLAGYLPPALLPRIRTVLAGTALATGLGLAWVVRGRQSPTRFVSVVIVTTMVIDLNSMIRMATQALTLGTALRQSPTARAVLDWDADSAVRTMPGRRRPDVLVLLLDAYAGDSLLLADYGVDHHRTRMILDSLGFIATTGIQSNYTHTNASVASFLSFSHLADLEQESIGRSQHGGFFYRLISRNRTIRLFRALGYETHWVPPPLFSKEALPGKEVQVHRAPRGPTDYLWLYAPIVQTWLEKVFTPGVVLHQLGFDFDIAGTHDAGLALLPELAADGRPSFAFVHLMSTHHPLMYAPDCQADPGVERRIPTSAAYAAAIRCLDEELIRTFRRVLTITGGDVVIVAIGDHAPSSLDNAEGDGPAERVPPGVAAGRFDATAFVYLPPGARQRFHTPRSEVNLIPEVLRSLFGAGIPDQPDTRYSSLGQPHRIYHFVEIP